MITEPQILSLFACAATGIMFGFFLGAWLMSQVYDQLIYLNCRKQDKRD